MQSLTYGIIFIFYVISFFTVTYFQVALTAVVHERISGGNIDFKEGIHRATQILGKIFVWSVIAATVGIVLKVIADRSQWLGKLVSSLLGAAWTIATLFIAPTLLLDNVSVWQSIKNSADVFKKTWGESIITNVSLGLFTFIAILLTVAFYVLLGLGLATIGFNLIGIMGVSILCVLTIILIAILSSCLSEIFKVALYSYARSGKIAEGFSPELIIGAVKEDSKK
jgi:hypothetical protein